MDCNKLPLGKDKIQFLGLPKLDGNPGRQACKPLMRTAGRIDRQADGLLHEEVYVG
jgi:hypothetical protein